MYLSRILETKIHEYVNFFSVVAITGPRQSGKSTLIRKILPNYKYVTFDNKVTMDLFYDDPQKFMRMHNHHVIFDEVQKAPEIFDYIKLIVDKDRQTPGKFILTGSSQLSFSNKVSESLAGRIGLLDLLPYEIKEIPEQFTKQSLFRGSYPELVQKNYALFDDWFASYIQTYVEKDLRHLAQVGDLRDFQKLVQLLAANTSQLLNMSSFSKAIGVDVKTIKRWISILEASYILFLHPPFYENFGKRVIKSPKIYFYDVGFVSHLCGVSNEELFEKGPLYGALFENYIVAELMKYHAHRKTHSKLYFYRTSYGAEIDVIIDHRGKKEFIEIKANETFKPKMMETIDAFLTSQDSGYLIYRGDSLNPMDNKRVCNYKDYFLK